MPRVYCSFCRASNEKAAMIVTGQAAHICDQCVEQARNIILKSKEEQIAKTKTRLIPPKEIKAQLDQYVIGQEEAKKILAVAVYNHYKRLMQPKTALDDVHIEKSNLILVGETGTGKTYLARTLARNILRVPFCIVDATILTEAGYVGEDVESILARLLQAADYDVSAAEKGIIYVDEIDKIARKSDNPSITRDVSGEGVQQGLLKLFEGSEVNVPPQGGRKHPDQKMIKVNTENILFICGGAFDGIDKIIARRMNTQPVGFSTPTTQNQRIDPSQLQQYIAAPDLKTFGLIPELLGRLPIVTHLNPLDATALRRILVEPKNALTKQYIKLFAMEGVKLKFTDDLLDYIVDKALTLKLGARGLRAICEAIITDLMFEVPSQKPKQTILLDKAYAEEKLNKGKLAMLQRVA